MASRSSTHLFKCLVNLPELIYNLRYKLSRPWSSVGEAFAISLTECQWNSAWLLQLRWHSKTGLLTTINSLFVKYFSYSRRHIGPELERKQYLLMQTKNALEKQNTKKERESVSSLVNLVVKGRIMFIVDHTTCKLNDLQLFILRVIIQQIWSVPHIIKLVIKNVQGLFI